MPIFAALIAPPSPPPGLAASGLSEAGQETSAALFSAVLKNVLGDETAPATQVAPEEDADPLAEVPIAVLLPHQTVLVSSAALPISGTANPAQTEPSQDDFGSWIEPADVTASEDVPSESAPTFDRIAERPAGPSDSGTVIGHPRHVESRPEPLMVQTASEPPASTQSDPPALGKGQAILEKALQTFGASFDDQTIKGQTLATGTTANRTAPLLQDSMAQTLFDAQSALEADPLIMSGERPTLTTGPELVRHATTHVHPTQVRDADLPKAVSPSALQAEATRDKSAISDNSRSSAPIEVSTEAAPPAAAATQSRADFASTVQAQIQGRDTPPHAQHLGGLEAGQSQLAHTDTPATSTPHSLPQTPSSGLAKASLETTAQISAQILRKLEGRTTRFDMVLTPESLGRVDVSLTIEADGQVKARLAFDNPAAALDMRGRADELRRQLADAGLNLSRDSLDFTDRNSQSDSGGGAFAREQDRRAFAGAARLNQEVDTAVLPLAPTWASSSLTPDRVDVKV